MYLVNLKKEMETEVMGNGTQMVVASIMSMMKDKTAEDETRTEMCFDEEGNLFVPDGIVLTEDTIFLLDTAADTVTILNKSPNEDGEEECVCGCCGAGSKYYYAVIFENDGAEDDATFEKFEVELLIMRDDPVAPQFIIGLNRDGKHLVQIERSQFEELEVGDDLLVYMSEYYSNDESSVTADAEAPVEE